MLHQQITAARRMATLETTVNIKWVNHKGCDRDCDVEVEYDFDGDDHLEIIKARTVGSCDLSSWEFDEAVHEAVADEAPEAFAEWLAERDEWAADARAAESYIQAGGSL